jgi:NADH dehydrogenase
VFVNSVPFCGMTETRQARRGVLIPGGGYAGAYIARGLGKRGATIVSPEHFLLFTPMRPEAASGTLEPRHVVVPLRQMCAHAELLLASVTAIGAEEQGARIERISLLGQPRRLE